MKRCLIFGAGEPCTRERITSYDKEDFIIAADGGYVWTQQEAIPVHVVLGDMDSLGAPAPPEKCLQYPVEKDDTDMGLAVEEGRRFGCQTFYLYGGTGGRADHTLANYQLLVNIARRGERGYLVDNRMTAMALCQGAVKIRGRAGKTLSVFAMDTQVEGVTLRNLKYELANATLNNAFSLGVSNSFTEATAEVSIEKGTLLIIGEYLPDDVFYE